MDKPKPKDNVQAACFTLAYILSKLTINLFALVKDASLLRMKENVIEREAIQYFRLNLFIS